MPKNAKLFFEGLLSVIRFTCVCLIVASIVALSGLRELLIAICVLAAGFLGPLSAMIFDLIQTCRGKEPQTMRGLADGATRVLADTPSIIKGKPKP